MGRLSAQKGAFKDAGGRRGVGGNSRHRRAGQALQGGVARREEAPGAVQRSVGDRGCLCREQRRAPQVLEGRQRESRGHAKPEDTQSTAEDAMASWGPGPLAVLLVGKKFTPAGFS